MIVFCGIGGRGGSFSVSFGIMMCDGVVCDGVMCDGMLYGV